MALFRALVPHSVGLGCALLGVQTGGCSAADMTGAVDLSMGEASGAAAASSGGSSSTAGGGVLGGGATLGGVSGAGVTSSGGVPPAAGGVGVGGFASGGHASGGYASGGAASGGAQSFGSASSGGGMSDSGGQEGMGQGGKGASGGEEGPTFHVFLLMGQSNMAGFPDALPEDRIADPRIQVLGFDDCSATGRKEGKWADAVPPLHDCWKIAVGPGDYFSKTIADHYPEGDTIGLVPLAVSGEPIEIFLDGGSKRSWMLSRAKQAQEDGGVIEGILFHHGESNCMQASWVGKVADLVSDVRSELGLGQIPFLAGELLYGGSCGGHNQYVAQLPGAISNAHVISAEGLVLDPTDTWDSHFDHDSQVLLGTRFAETMIDVLALP